MARSSAKFPPPPPNRLESAFDDPPRNNVLLLSCMDQRLLDDTVVFMNLLNLQNRYDQIALAGGAMGANRLNPPSSDWKQVFFDHMDVAINTLHRPIKDVFLFEHLDCGAYKYFHPRKDDYKAASLKQMLPIHKEELEDFARQVNDHIAEQLQSAVDELHAARLACEKCKEEEKKTDKKSKDEKPPTCWELVKELAEKKAEAWKEIRVSCFVMDLVGVIKQLGVPKGQRSTVGTWPHGD